MKTARRPSGPKWGQYKQLSIRIGQGQEAADYLARIDAAMAACRRRTRADWLKYVIDLALDYPDLFAAADQNAQSTRLLSSRGRRPRTS